MDLGRALFAVTLAEAQTAGLATIDVTMPTALAYYDAVGFRTWRRIGGAVGKRLDLRDRQAAEVPSWRFPAPLLLGASLP